MIMDVKSVRNNLIDPAFEDVEGILTVQQNNGSGNAITAATGVVANLGGAGDSSPEALAQGDVADASQVAHALPTTYDGGSNRTNTVTDWSFSGLRGIATVQQNNGDKNAMSSAIAVAANTGDGKLDDVPVQKARADGSVDNVRAEDRDNADAGLRRNTLDDHVFNAAAGIVTVQQNNGSNNAINAAVSVRAETESTVTSSPGEDDVTAQFAGARARVRDATADSQHQTLNGLASRHNLLTHAFTGGVDGIYTVQQNNGDNNAISASTALAADINTADDIDAVVDNEAKTVTKVGTSTATDDFTGRVNTLNDGAFEDAAGIVTVQQNNGDNNAIAAATGVVANIDTGFRFGKAVTADATGDAEVTGNTATTTSVYRNNTVDDAMNGIQGVVTVQQNNGDNNSISAANDVVVSTEMPGFGPAASSATLGATVSGNTSTINVGSVLANTQTGSFAGASGLITVQQNNGNNNVLGSAITTVANGITFAFNN
jgi:hypothetical protein